jgi:hypothetical protein
MSLCFPQNCDSLEELHRQIWNVLVKISWRFVIVWRELYRTMQNKTLDRSEWESLWWRSQWWSPKGVKCVIIDTNHIQAHAEIPDISSQHNRDAVQHEPNGLPAHVTVDSCNQWSQHGKCCCLSTNGGSLWTDLRYSARLYSWSKIHDGTNVTQGIMAYQFKGDRVFEFLYEGMCMEIMFFTKYEIIITIIII